MAWRLVCFLQLQLVFVAGFAAADQPGGRPDDPGPEDLVEVSAPQWMVTGHIVDSNGAPMAEVEVVAHCGIGTLWPTGRAVTDSLGQYTLRFSPGMRSTKGETPLQAATISPRKAGWVERNLHRQGNLLMSEANPDPEAVERWRGAAGVVAAGEAYELDFVMIPAASIEGVLMDGEGEPIAGRRLTLQAEKLPPSCSVLAVTEADAEGRFKFTEVPPGEVWLEVDRGKGRRAIKTERFECGSGAVREVDVTLETGEEQVVLEVDGAAG